jgi:hypothetical protein
MGRPQWQASDDCGRATASASPAPIRRCHQTGGQAGRVSCGRRLAATLTDTQLEHWAGELDTDLDQLDQLASLIGRQMLSLFENDPKEAARWLLRELGWLGLHEVSEAISEVMVDEADDEPITE